MDTSDEMMMHLFIKEEANTFADEVERFMILAALLKLQEHKNAAPNLEVSVGEINRSQSREGRIMRCSTLAISPRINIYHKEFSLVI
jgi:hypothetical protein